MHCCCTIYDSFEEHIGMQTWHFKSLECQVFWTTVQNQAIRIATGAFKTGPIESLLVESNQQDLSESDIFSD